MRRCCVAILALTVWAASGPVVVAKVATIPLAELVDHAEFIGIVRVERLGWRLPLLKRPRATARILESWKGPTEGTVTFVAAAAWTCDISEAKKGEEAVVFIRARNLEHSGRGRMPIFVREGRRFAAVWPDVRLPQGMVTEAGPEPEFRFIVGVSIDSLRDAVAAGAAKTDLK